jgi:hypothetical protein
MDIILTQTNYTREEAEALLEEHKDPMIVIKKYLGIEEKPQPKKSINQQIYKMLRKQIDISAFNAAQMENLNKNLT